MSTPLLPQNLPEVATCWRRSEPTRFRAFPVSGRVHRGLPVHLGGWLTAPAIVVGTVGLWLSTLTGSLCADPPPAIAPDSGESPEVSPVRHPAPSESKLAARLYATEMALGWQYWKQGAIRPLRDLLNRQVPQPGTPADADRRGFEWHYLDRLAHGEIAVLPGSFPVTRGLKFLGDTGRLASFHRIVTNTQPGELRLWTLSEQNTSEVLLREQAKEEGPAIRIGRFAASPDGLTLAVDQGEELQFLNVLTGESLVIPTGHTDSLGALTFSPTGEQLATGFLDGTVRLWDRQTGTIVGELQGHRMGVLAIAWSPSGEHLVTGTGDDRAPLHFQQKNGELKLWDPSRRECICTFPNVPSQVNCVAFAGSRWVVSGGNAGEVLVWDTTTGLQVRRLGTQVGPIRDLAIASDPLRVVAACQDGTSRVWNVETGEELATFRGHEGAVTAVSLEPATGRLATGGWDGTIRLWELSQPIERANLGVHPWTILEIHHPADGQSVVTVDYTTVHVFDSHTRRELRTIRPGHWTTSSALSPDGQRVVLGGFANPDGGGTGHVSLWSLQTGERLAAFDPLSGRGIRVELSPDGNWLASTGFSPQREQRLLSLWELTPTGPGKRLGGWTISAEPVFTADNRSLVVAQPEGLRLFDLQTQTLGSPLVEGERPFVQVSAAPIGNRLAATTAEGEVTLWNLERQVVEHRGRVHDAAVSRLLFSRRGETLVTGSRDETRLWTVAPFQLRAELPIPACEMLITPDNRTLVTAWRTLDFWHLETGLPMLQLEDYQMEIPNCLRISPDGNCITEGGGWRDENEGVYLWQAAPRPR